MSKSKVKPKQLKAHERAVLFFAVLLLRIWLRTLRYSWGKEVQALLDDPPPPAVIIAWHNRLFVTPEFYRRYYKHRKLATIISTSSDGGWLAGLFEHFKIMPVRGSRHRRGAQAFRELLAANQAGYDVGLTPDGSRGPMYDMKPGAIAVALKAGAPVVMFSFNFCRAWRLRSWDKFYLPYPFSRIEVKMDFVEDLAELGTEDPKAAAAVLKTRMDAITQDALR